MFRWLIGLTVVAGLAASMVAAPVSAHRTGSWLYPPQVGSKLDATGRFDLPACTGKGRYRWTRRSRPNSQQTWQFRHFECFTYNAIGYPGVVFMCVHSLSGGRIAITRVMQNNAYRPCRF